MSYGPDTNTLTPLTQLRLKTLNPGGSTTTIEVTPGMTFGDAKTLMLKELNLTGEIRCIQGGRQLQPDTAKLEDLKIPHNSTVIPYHPDCQWVPTPCCCMQVHVLQVPTCFFFPTVTVIAAKQKYILQP